MRFLVIVTGFLVNTCLHAQHAQNDFLAFKEKSDSLAKVVDNNASRLHKETMQGEIKNEAFKADVFIDKSTNTIYKIIYRLQTDAVSERERIFYSYDDHLTRMVIGGKFTILLMERI